MTAKEFNHELTIYKEPLTHYALRLTSNKEQAEDLVQDTYLKALSYKDKFLNYSYQNLRGWLFTILKNTFINAYRVASRRPQINDFTVEDSFINKSNEYYYSNPEEIYYSKEVSDNLNQLDNKFRVPLKLFLKGYKYHEIAKRLNLKIGTVKSRIFFTRQKLKYRLELVT